MAELDPVTGKDPSTLTVAQLAERLAMERALREQATNYVERALALQAAEYERRLSDLNHAHAQAVEAQAQTVPRELFEQYVKEQAARDSAQASSRSEAAQIAHDGINARIDTLDLWRSGIEGRLIGISVVVGVVVIIINLAIRLL